MGRPGPGVRRGRGARDVDAAGPRLSGVLPAGAQRSTPWVPRFKSASRFDSVEYSEGSGWRVKGNRLYLRGVGEIRFRTSRRGILGVPRTLAVRREGRRWRFTVFCVKVTDRRLGPTGKQIGIDLGIRELVATSDGELVANPRWATPSTGWPPRNGS